MAPEVPVHHRRMGGEGPKVRGHGFLNWATPKSFGMIGQTWGNPWSWGTSFSETTTYRYGWATDPHDM